METFYLVDFENVGNTGIKNIESLTKENHVRIFTTENALNVRVDYVLSKEVEIQMDKVPKKKQSVDMHLVSYLGYLIGLHKNDCAYVIISNDKDYDNIIKFWKEKEISNICRESEIKDKRKSKKKEDATAAKKAESSAEAGNIQRKTKTAAKSDALQKKTKTAAKSDTVQKQTVNNRNDRIDSGMSYNFSGNDRTELNTYIQKELKARGYKKDVNEIGKIIFSHCNNGKIILDDIRSTLEKTYSYSGSIIYKDIENILNNFLRNKNQTVKRERCISC